MVKPDSVFVCGLRPKVAKWAPLFLCISRLGVSKFHTQLMLNAISFRFAPFKHTQAASLLTLFREKVWIAVAARAARIYWIAGQRQKRRRRWHTGGIRKKVIPQRAAAIKLWVAFMKGVIRLAPSSRARTDWRRLLATPFRVWKEEAFEASMEPWESCAHRVWSMYKCVAAAAIIVVVSSATRLWALPRRWKFFNLISDRDKIPVSSNHIALLFFSHLFLYATIFLSPRSHLARILRENSSLSRCCHENIAAKVLNY